MITLTTIGHKQRRNRNYRRVWPVAPTSSIGTTAPAARLDLGGGAVSMGWEAQYSGSALSGPISNGTWTGWVTVCTGSKKPLSVMLGWRQQFGGIDPNQCKRAGQRWQLLRLHSDDILHDHLR